VPGERDPCVMSEKGTGTCQACRAQKRKCSKTFESTRKLKKVASMAEGSSRKTSESSQGRDRSGHRARVNIHNAQADSPGRG